MKVISSAVHIGPFANQTVHSGNACNSFPYELSFFLSQITLVFLDRPLQRQQLDDYIPFCVPLTEVKAFSFQLSKVHVKIGGIMGRYFKGHSTRLFGGKVLTPLE